MRSHNISLGGSLRRTAEAYLQATKSWLSCSYHYWSNLEIPEVELSTTANDI